uniref:Reverse transcriptase zinc-binding domain-containing protein n=1 Tax=Lactuca sativa TaxID=4236 RepID=A0A9R1X3P1_LACSA|nr:hypothetical protein LSAT_V11C700352930 [Lactuca sativa]
MLQVKWITWLLGCLSLSCALVLFNRSLTIKFPITKGLNVSLKSTREKSLFNCIKVPNFGPMISHIFYVGDVIFNGDWNCSSIKISFVLSKFSISCSSLKLIFISLVSSHWKPILDKFHSNLSIWKANSLSFGRLPLINYVLESLPAYFFSVFKGPIGFIESLEKLRFKFLWGGDNKKEIHSVHWNKVVTSKSNDSLGLGTLIAQNLSLLIKWWSRIMNEVDSFWKMVTMSIHNLEKKPASYIAQKTSNSVWCNVFKAVKRFFLPFPVLVSTSYFGKIGDVRIHIARIYSMNNMRMLIDSKSILTNGPSVFWSWLIPLKVRLMFCLEGSSGLDPDF